MASMLEFPGTHRYKVIRRVGEGAMGAVYEAQDDQRGHAVALKTLLHASPGAIYHFKQEFRALADVSHRHLVTLYELVKHDDLWFFTMELVAGVSFLSWCRSDVMADSDLATELLPTVGADVSEPAPLPSSPVVAPSADGLVRLRTALAGLAEGLTALHDFGKLHRDIKPSNVLITPEGRAVLLDFGLSADVGEDRETAPKPAVGTVAYMPPELSMDGSPSPAADWYAVGTMLYQALTGRLPFAGQVFQVVKDRQQRSPTRPQALLKDLPEDLCQLCTDLLSIDPEARPNGTEVLRRLGRAAPKRRPRPQRSSAFVGRRPEIERIAEVIDETRRGTATVVHVHGPPGIGKTALLRYGLPRWPAPVWHLDCRCYAHELVPFKAVDGLIDALARQLKARPASDIGLLLPPGIGTLAQLFPVLNRVEAIRKRAARTPTVSEASSLRQRAFAAFRGLLFALGRDRPVLMIIDDVHHGDIDSAQLLTHALGPPEPPGVVVIVAYPSTATNSPVVRQLTDPAPGSFGVVDLPLAPLSLPEAEQLAKVLLIAGPGARDRVNADHAPTIAAEAEGLPLFVHALATESTFNDSEGTEQDPLTIDRLTRRRAQRLDERATALLEVVAVANDALPIGLALSAAGLSVDDQGPVTALLSGHFARRRGPDRIEPFHPRVGAAIRESLSAEARQHRADAVSKRRRRPSTAATPRRRPQAVEPLPFDAGSTLPAAGAIAPPVGSGSAVTLAPPPGRPPADPRTAPGMTASTTPERVPALPAGPAAMPRPGTTGPTPLSPPPPRPGAASFNQKKEYARLLEEAGRFNAGDAYLEAAALTDDPLRQREMKRRAAEQWLRLGRIAEGEPLLQEVLHALEMPIPDAPARITRRLAIERTRLVRRGLTWQDAAPDQLGLDAMHRTDACWTAATGMLMGAPITAALYSTRYLTLALDLGDPNRVARALAMELALSTAEGRPTAERRRTVLDALRTVAKRIDAPYVRGFAAVGAGLAALHEGRWAETGQCCTNAERVLDSRCTGVEWELQTTRAIDLWARTYRGRFRPLRAQLDNHLQRAQARPHPYGTTLLSILPAVQTIWLADNDPVRARQQLEAAPMASDRAPMLGFWRAAAAIQLDLYTGDRKDAFRRFAPTVDQLAANGNDRVQLIRVEALYLRARAALAAVAEDPGQRPLLAQARTDAAQLQREGRRWAMGLGLLIEGRALQSLGLTAEARERLGDAAAVFGKTGMEMLAAVAQARRSEIDGAHDEPRIRLETAGVRNPSAWLDLVAP